MAGLDINKILKEAVNDEEKNQEGENQNQELNENENQTQNTDEGQQGNEEQVAENELPNSIYASAVSSGLGALSLRNRMRTLSESKKKKQ